MSVADPIGAVVALLRADASVSALAGARVYSGELPRSENTNMPRQSVVVMPAGGPRSIGRGFQRYGDSRIDVMAYGAVRKEAWILSLTIAQTLDQMRQHVTNGVVLYWARPSAQPNFALDPETQWPAYLASYQVLASLTT